MAPLKSTKKAIQDRRIDEVIGCAEDIIAALHRRSTFRAPLEARVEKSIKSAFPLPSSSSSAAERARFDTLGCQIWNATTDIIRSDGEESGDAQRHYAVTLSISLRVFAFLLIDASRHASRGSGDHDQLLRIFKVALKACRSCLDKQALELTLKVLERCADYVSVLEAAEPVLRISSNPDEDRGDRELALRLLIIEYYLLRITHAWKSDRLGVAEHFFAKVEYETLSQSVELAEKAADLFHEAAKSLASKGLTEPSVVWCERALSALDTCNSEDVSPDAADLRLTVTATLIEVSLIRDDQPSYERAIGLVQQLEEVYGLGNRIAVSLLRFKTIRHKRPVDAAEIGNVLRRMMRIAVLTDHSFRIIMQAIHKAERCSVRCATECVYELITLRLIPDLTPDADIDDPSMERLEKAVVTYFKLAASPSEVPPGVQVRGASDLLDLLSDRHHLVLSPRATHAVQTLVWKVIDTVDPEVTAEWCTALQHPVFDKSGQMNKARIGRKAISTALARGDTNAAREAFFRMKPAAQNEDLSRLLAFKIALRSSDSDFARECLSQISKGAGKDSKCLYACVLEAQQSEMRALAIAALQVLLDKQPTGVHLPSLLRCTVRLLIGELDVQGADVDRVMEEIVQAFETAAANIKLFRQATDEQWQNEIQWWSKNAYNLAVRSCAGAHPEHIVRLLAACTKFLDTYPPHGGDDQQRDLMSRRLVCFFLSATALTVLARSGVEGSEQALQYYLRAQQQTSLYLETASAMSNPPDGALITARKLEMLKYQLECIFKLQQWADLDAAIKSLLDFDGIDRWDSLADLLIIIHERTMHLEAVSSAHTRITELLQRCINETWKKDKDINKMSRWLRLAFSIYLVDDEAGLALKIVQQAAGIAKRGCQNVKDIYPDDELQWLACSAFNKAVDLLAINNQATVHTWIDAALEMARYAGDNGALHAHLTHKRKVAEQRMQSMEV